MAICTECRRGHGYRGDACCLCNEYGFSRLGTFGGRALGPGVYQWWAGGRSCNLFGPYGACAGIRGLGSITITKDDTLNRAASPGRAGPFNIWQQKIITPVSQRPKAATLCCCGSLTRCRTWPQSPACKCTALIRSDMTPLTKPSAEETLRR